MKEKELEDIRLFLEQKWYEWKKERNKTDKTLSEGMCNFSSFFLKELLGKEWRIAGGFAEPSLLLRKEMKKQIKGGFCKNNIFYDHHWVTNGNTIIDLTADQFGDRKIIVTNINDSRYIDNLKIPYSVYKKNAYSAIQWAKEYNDMIKNNEIILYHGTTEHNANLLIENGWTPNSHPSGNHCGQTKFLYLTNEPENALWYSEEKGEHVVLSIKISKNNLKVDPEDGIEETVEKELNNTVGNLVLFKDVPANSFSFHHLTKKSTRFKNVGKNIMTEKFYCATAEKNLISIKENGLNPYSYWISNQHPCYEEILAYYEETVEDDGDKPIILIVERSELEENQMEPDYPGIDEPITTALNTDEENILKQWEKCEGTTQDCINIIGTLRYKEKIPSNILMIEIDDESIPLIEHMPIKPSF